MTRQAMVPCPVCESWYRIGTQCNRCGHDCSDDPAEIEPWRYSKAGRAPEGQGWDPKTHKVIWRKA